MKYIPEREINENCGILGVIISSFDAFKIAYNGLCELQHRGQESAGISIFTKGKIRTHKGMGLIKEVFNGTEQENTQGKSAIGHTKYSTTGNSVITNAQPFDYEDRDVSFALAHNGNITNFPNLLKDFPELERDKISDSKMIAHMLTMPRYGDSLKDRILACLKILQGSYCLVILSKNELYAVRDPWGFRPLLFGRLPEKGFVVASEVGALQKVGCTDITEIAAGSVISFTHNNYETIYTKQAKNSLALCTFEHIYFSRRDNIFDGMVVSDVRFRLGEELAKESFVNADFIVPIPQSAIDATKGYASKSQEKYREILEVDKTIGRTFLQPAQSDRDERTSFKYNVSSNDFLGKSIVLVDDSLVRGTTIRYLIKYFRKRGVRQVHLRIASPPLLHPCFMGIDISNYEQLLAHNKQLDQIRNILNADSISYLTMEGMKRALRSSTNYCNACFTGNYPFSIPAK